MTKSSILNKVLLFVGLIAFSFVCTLDKAVAAQDECKAAQSEYKAAQKEQTKALQDAQKEVTSAANAISKARSSCTTELQYCTTYQASLVKKQVADNKYKEVEAAQKEKVLAAQSKVNEKCASKINTEISTEGIEGKERIADRAAEKAAAKQEVVSAQYNAVQSNLNDKKAATEKANNELTASKQAADAARKSMEDACSDPNSPACTQAIQSVNSANKTVRDKQEAVKTARENQTKAAEELSDAQKDLTKAERKADKKQTKAENKAQKAVDNAQSKVDDYCSKGSSKYNPSKCESAQKDLAKATANETYSEMKSAEDAQKKANEDAAAKAAQEAKDAAAKAREESYQQDIDNALNDYSSTAQSAQNAAAKAAQSEEAAAAAAANLQAAEEQVNAACLKPNSRACKNATEAYSKAEAANNQAQAQAKADQSKNNEYQEKVAAAEKAIAECDPSDAKCASAQADKNKTDATNALNNAKNEQEQAVKEQQKAEEQYQQALDQMSAACAEPESEACKTAKDNFAAAKQNKDDANQKVESTAQAVNDANKNLDDAAKKSLEAGTNEASQALAKNEQELADAKEKATEACNKDANSQECKTAQANLDKLEKENTELRSENANYAIANAEAKVEEACADDPESEECKAAKAELEAANQQRADIDNEIKSEQFKAQMEAAEAKAAQTCEEKGVSSTECLKALAERDKLKRQYISQTCQGDPDCEISLLYGDSVVAAEGVLKVTTDSEGGKGVIDISQSRQIVEGKGDEDDYTLAGYRSKYFNYESGSDVLEIVTRRAALVVVSLKPIVYVFAGFGLIAFAWMAIFNKISWKWFGNIAIGLFLVANMGRFIEYFVAGDGDTHYYIGVWDSNATEGGRANKLANAFADSYYVYGDTVQSTRGVEDFSEIIRKIEEDRKNDYYAAKGGSGGEEPEARKFCQGTSGSGWGNFTSCIKDIVATAKKVADTAKTVKATVEDVKARVETVKDSVSNIKQAVQAMKGGSITDIIAGAGNILNNVNSVVSTTTGAVGSLTNAASSISNNVQDMGKSVEQQKQLQDKRNKGEATNALDAMIKGQAWDKENKTVLKEDTVLTDTQGNALVDAYGKPITKETVVSQGSAISKINDVATDIKNKSSTVNNLSQDFLMQAGTVSNIVENASFGGKESINEKRQRKQEEKVIQQKAQAVEAAKVEYLNSNAGKNATYMEQTNRVNNLSNSIKQQQNELGQLKQQQSSAQAVVDKSCSDPDDTSATCSAARKNMEAINSAISSKENQIKDTEAAYETAKENEEIAYQNALNSNIAEAEKAYNEANSRAEQLCNANAGSSECAKARQDVIAASNKLLSYTNEQENGPIDEKAIAKEEYLNSNAGKNETYMDQANKTSNLYDSIQQQERELNQIKQQQKEAEQAVEKNCSDASDTSSLCNAARNNKNAIDNMLTSKEELLENTKSEYEVAKKDTEQAYQAVLDSNIAQAEQEYNKANDYAEEICKSDSGSVECAKARQDVYKASSKLMSYTNEKENKTGDSRYETKEDVVNNLVTSQQKQELKAMENLLDYEQEQSKNREDNQGYYANQEYQQTVDKMDNLYNQVNILEQESEDIKNEINKKEEEASNACAQDPGGAVCSTAKIAVETAKDSLNTKQIEIEKTKQKYSEAKKDSEQAYQNMLNANKGQAQNDLVKSNKAAEEAKQQLEDINSKIGDVATAADKAKTEYDTAVQEAQSAREAYNQALSAKQDQGEIDRLKQIYEDKLTEMSNKKKDYDTKTQEYNNLSQDKKAAEIVYIKSKDEAKDASERLASYTNEDVNKTGDNYINSQEEINNQIIMKQYLSDTNPSAEAQASKTNYIEQKNKADIAEYTLKEKKAVADQAYKEYQAAYNKCQETNSSENCRIAERLQKNYDLAQNELKIAQNSYNILQQEMEGYKTEYKVKSLSAEKYNQQKYINEMQQASIDINRYEAAVSRQRQVVDNAALKYTEAKNNLQEGDQAGLSRAAQLYKSYLEAKDLYTSYQNSLNQARNNYTEANNKYQESVSEQQRLENELSRM